MCPDVNDNRLAIAAPGNGKTGQVSSVIYILQFNATPGQSQEYSCLDTIPKAQHRGDLSQGTLSVCSGADVPTSRALPSLSARAGWGNAYLLKVLGYR
ncbi:MAG: hypothetical protein ACI9MC_003885 [Kiritimatiellia bacterium]